MTKSQYQEYQDRLLAADTLIALRSILADLITQLWYETEED